MTKLSHSTKKTLQALASFEHTPTMPIAFIGHGNPMNAINDSQFASEWQRIATLIPIPKAIIVMSAHWLTRGTYITAMEQPKTIHDMYGFPQELYTIEYTAPGHPELAADISSIATHIETDHHWGYDHGAWTVLLHMYPNMNIPVLQLSIDMTCSLDELYELTAQLRQLREHGILIMGSGNIVHNLGYAVLSDTATAFDWAEEFDEISAKHIEKRDFNSLLHYSRFGRSAELAIPTEDHYRPMIMTLALSTETDALTFFNEHIDAASVSMRSFLLSPQ